MGSITITNLDDGVEDTLRRRAARHGRSLEDEARLALTTAAAEREPNLYEAIRAIVEPTGGFDLDLPPRKVLVPRVTFEE